MKTEKELFINTYFFFLILIETILLTINDHMSDMARLVYYMGVRDFTRCQFYSIFNYTIM